jgi:tRNA nucleotidyltransferase/poly(A) polymerase
VRGFQKHVYREYVEQLILHGHHVFITGGVLRDLLARLKAKPDGEASEHLRNLTPLDLATTASALRVRGIVHAMATDEPDGGAWQTYVDDEQGTLNVGGRPAGSPSSRGLTITPLRSFGYRQPRLTDEAGKRIFPICFGHSLEEDSAARDFTMNALYARFDMEKGAFFLTDPFGGRGVADAEARLLRLVPEAQLDSESLLLRFWNFRRRGFNAEAATIAELKSASDAVLTRRTPERLAEILARLLFNEAKTQDDLELCFQRLSDAMTKDGAGELFGTLLGSRKVRTIVARRHSDRLLQR